MTLEIVLVVFIILMLGYIIYLHIQLAKRKLFIESTVRRLTGIEKSWSSEELMKFLHEIRKVSHYNSFFTDRLFDEKPLDFLLEDQKTSRIYIHYTKEEADAKNILKDGFLFADSFYKTALPVTNDRLDLLIKHNSRKSFGDYVVVICLSDKLFKHYSDELDKNSLKGFFVENVLTEVPPFRNDNADLIYQLSNKFIKGFINHITGEITPNPDYNPIYDSPAFTNNLEVFKKQAVKLI